MGICDIISLYTVLVAFDWTVSQPVIQVIFCSFFLLSTISSVFSFFLPLIIFIFFLFSSLPFSHTIVPSLLHRTFLTYNPPYFAPH
ncbi:hypothetical protein CLU79DRAFT_747926 [Phycomyces nitens]|nr:hypothetical protein CLU79DRAFT_747926 [Phycomyces nitens]